MSGVYLTHISKRSSSFRLERPRINTFFSTNSIILPNNSQTAEGIKNRFAIDSPTPKLDQNLLTLRSQKVYDEKIPSLGDSFNNKKKNINSE